jgi:hypothetical protein
LDGWVLLVFAGGWLQVKPHCWFFCTKFRELNKPLPSDRDEAKYIVFDGDVDAVSGVERVWGR